MDYKIWSIFVLFLCGKEVGGQAWRISTACYGNEGLNCSFHHFECQNTDHIAVNGAEYFYKESTRCGMGVGNCDVHRQACCLPEQNDCSLPYTRADVARLKICLRKPHCVFKTPWSTHKCIANKHLVQFSSYSVIFYECIKEFETIDFCDGSMIGNSVSIMYDPSRHAQYSDSTCACMTSGTRAGHTPLFIEALDVHLGNASSTHCSTLVMNSKDRDFIYSCTSNGIHPSQMLIPVNASLPIRSELEISKTNPPHRVWIRIQAKQAIKVICQRYVNEQPTTAFNRTEITTPVTQDSNLEQNIWLTIGGSVGGILCIVAVCIVCFYCVRKYREHKTLTEDKDSHEYFEIEPSGVFSVERASEGSEYYEIRDNEPQPMYDHYYSSADRLERQSAHALNSLVISGYDHLRLQNVGTIPTASYPGSLRDDVPESRYNRLNEKGQVVFRSDYDRSSVAV